MSISSEVRKAGPFAGNDVATAFPFTFKVFAASEVLVVQANASGVESTLSMGTDYTVTLNTDQNTSPGGSVVTAAPLADGFKLVIASRVQNLQPADLTNNGGFYPSVINAALDRATIQIQQIKEQVDRSAKLPITSAADAASLFDDLIRVADSIANVDAVAGSISSVDTVASNIGDVATVASNIADVTNFSDVYLGGKASDPTARNDGSALQNGDLYFNTAIGKLKVYSTSDVAWREGYGYADLISYTPSGTGAVPTNVQAKLREFVSVKDFGAVGDGVADDTAAIQAALNSGAKLITSPANARYRITDTLVFLNSNVSLDLAMSELLLDDPTGLKDHVFLGDGLTQRNSIRLKEIIFTRQQVATSGWAINSNLIGVCHIERCRIYGNNKIFGGIRIYRGIIINIIGCYVDGCLSDGIYLIGSGLLANRTVDVSIRETRIEYCLRGLRLGDFVEGLFFRDNIIYATTSDGAVVDATVDANGLNSFKFQESDFDTCGGYGLYIDKISNTQVTGCWFSNNANTDLVIKDKANGVVATGNQHYPNTLGVHVYGNNAVISSNLISGGTTCIAIDPLATNTNVSGNTLSYAQNGIDITTSTQSLISGNLIHNMSVAPIFGGGGAGTVIRGNNGDTAAGVSSFITVGASPFTYTAGARPEHVSVFGGTVSQVALGANAVSFVTNCSVSLAPRQSVTVTYSSVPFMVRNVQ